MKPILIAFMAGSLVTGGLLGTVGFFQIKSLQTQNARLQEQAKKQSWRQDNLLKSQANLEEELKWFKEEKAKTYEQTIDSLMQAKDNADIHALYEIGLKALEEKDYPLAYFSLSQVLHTDPPYKAIQKYYPEAKKAYESHQAKNLEEQLKSAYSQAYDQQSQRQFAQVQVNYQRVLDLQPDYKDAKKRLKTVTDYLTTRQRTQEQEQKKQWLEATYKLGVREQGYGRYAQAQEAYKNILAYAPNYKDTLKRLKWVSARVPPPQVAKAPTRGQQINCYEKGVAVGKCATAGPEATHCTQASISSLSAGCKDHPEFAKGLKATVQSKSPATTLLKDLPDLLQNL